MNPEIKSCEKYIHALSISNEFLAIYPPNRLHMRALPKLLKYTSNIELYSESQEIIEKTLKKLKIGYIPPEGSFYLFAKIPDGIDEIEFCESMCKNFIVVVPGTGFGAKGFYRISFCKGPEDIKRGMEQFEKSYIKVISELSEQSDKKIKE